MCYFFVQIKSIAVPPCLPISPLAITTRLIHFGPWFCCHEIIECILSVLHFYFVVAFFQKKQATDVQRSRKKQNINPLNERVGGWPTLQVNRYFPTLTKSVQRTEHCLEIRQTCESIHPFHHCHHPPDLGLGLTTQVVIDQMQIYWWKGKIPMFWSCFESFWHEWDGCRRMLKGRGVRRCPSIVNDY